MADKRSFGHADGKNTILMETWKSVHELKAGLKRTEDKIASLKSIKIDSLFTFPKDASALKETKQNDLYQFYSDQRGMISSSDISTDLNVRPSKNYIRNKPSSSYASSIGSSEFSSFEEFTDIKTGSNLSSISSSSDLDYISLYKNNIYRPVKAVKEFEVNYNGKNLQLERLKRLIERQAADRNKDAMKEYQPDEPPAKIVHHENDFVEKSLTNSWYGLKSERRTMVRKIAVGDGPSSYKGFSGNNLPFIVSSTNIVSSKTVVNDTAVGKNPKSKKVRKQVINATKQKSIITPATWKTDATSQKFLLKSKLQHRKTTSKQSNEIKESDQKAISRSEFHAPFIRTADIKPSAEIDSKIMTGIKDLKKFLGEKNDMLGTQEKDVNEDKSVKPNKSNRVRRLRRKKSNKSLEKKPAVKVVHYDHEKVQQYMERKRNEHKRNLVKENQTKKFEALQKKKRLEALYSTQKKNCKLSIKTGDKSKLNPTDKINECCNDVNEEVSAFPSFESCVTNRTLVKEQESSFHQEFSQVAKIQAMAQSIQNQVDQETLRIKKFYEQTTRLKDLENLILLQQTPKDSPKTLKNKAAVKIQALWRGYSIRKNVDLDGLSEGSLASDDECFKMADSDSSSSSPQETHPDPFNFINSVSKKKLFFISRNKIPINTADDRKTTGKLDLESLSSISEVPSSGVDASLSSKNGSDWPILKSGSGISSGGETSPQPIMTDSKEKLDREGSCRSLTPSGGQYSSNLGSYHLSYQSDFDNVSGLSEMSKSCRSSTSETMKSGKSNDDVTNSTIRDEVLSAVDSHISEECSVANAISEGRLSSADLVDFELSVSSELEDAEKTLTPSKMQISSHVTSNTETQSPEEIPKNTDTTVSSTETSKAKLSPFALKERMNVEVNYLDSIARSLQRVNNVDKIRTDNNAAKSIELLQMNDAKRQREMDTILEKISEQRLVAENRLEMQLKEHDRALKSATENILQVRQETSQMIQKDTRQILVHQAQATQVTAEATKKLAEVLHAIKIQPANQSSESNSVQQESYSVPDLSGGYVSHSKTFQSSATSASGASKTSNTPTSISTETSKSPAIISEEISSVRSSLDSPISEAISNHDESEPYSISFEGMESAEEAHEKSYRLILPSKSHQIQSLNSSSQSLHDSLTEHNSSAPSSLNGTMSNTSQTGTKKESRSSLFSARGSFERFTMDMVKRYMKEGELRAHHQEALLKLREKAVVEKTKAEIAWLELQKKSLRQKGEDDQMPPIRKRQRGLLLRMQQEQAEIKRLKDVQKVAKQERLLLFKQQEDIYKLQKSTKQILEKIKMNDAGAGTPFKSLSQLSLASSVRNSRLAKNTATNSDSQISASPSIIETETNTSVQEEETSAIEEIEHSTTKSTSSAPKTISEMKSRESQRTLQSLESMLENLKHIKASKRDLTKREQKLVKRKQTVEELIHWNRKLDKEEAEIKNKERLIIKKMDSNKTRKPLLSSTLSKTDTSIKECEESDVSTANGSDKSLESPSIIEEISGDQIRSLVSEPIDTVNEDLFNSSAADKTPSFADTILTDDKLVASNSNQSDIKTAISSKFGDSSDYSESFESGSKKSEPNLQESQRSYLSSSNISTASHLPISIKKFLRSHKRHDSSGSDDSFTVSMSETASDQSDVEGRIIALRDELRRRKAEANRLKRELKKFNQERLRAQEVSLKKQLEAYDKFIQEAANDLKKELEIDHQQTPIVAVKPKIKHPESRLKRQSEQSGSSTSTLSPEKSIAKDVESADTTSDARSILELSVNQSVSETSNLIKHPESRLKRQSEQSESSTSTLSPEKSITKDVESADTTSDARSILELSVNQSVSETSNLGTSVKTDDARVISEETFSVDSSDVSDVKSQEEVHDEVDRCKKVEDLADNLTEALLNEMISESIDIIVDLVPAHRQPEPAVEETVSKGRLAEAVATKMSEELLGNAMTDMLKIYQKIRVDVAIVSSSSSISERVSLIMSELHDKQATPPREKSRPQDLMVLSPMLVEANDEPVASENFPFTDVFTGDNKFQPSEDNLDKDLLSNEVFEDQEWFDDDFGFGAGNTSAKNPNDVYTPCYYREIPNKPPPPYIPPKSGPYSVVDQSPQLSTPAMQPKVNFKRMNIEVYSAVPNQEKEVLDIVRSSFEYVYSMLESGMPMDQMCANDFDYFDKEDMDIGLHGKSSHAYKLFLFDLVKESLSKNLRSGQEESYVGVKNSLKRFVASNRPKYFKSDLQFEVEKEISDLFGFRKQPISRLVSGTGFNAVLSLGCKKRDRVSDILFQELVEEEKEWLSFDEEENILKEQISNSIFDDIFRDAIHSVSAIDEKRARSLDLSF